MEGNMRVRGLIERKPTVSVNPARFPVGNWPDPL